MWGKLLNNNKRLIILSNYFKELHGNMMKH